MSTQQPGRIITFYSYKGGTGRTMALANTACLLARHLSQENSNKGARVIANWLGTSKPRGCTASSSPIWSEPTVKTLNDCPWLPDLFIKLYEYRSAYKPNDFVSNRRYAYECLSSLNFEEFLIETTIPGLAIIKSGRFDEKYSERVGQFSWDEFFHATLGCSRDSPISP